MLLLFRESFIFREKIEAREHDQALLLIDGFWVGALKINGYMKRIE